MPRARVRHTTLALIVLAALALHVGEARAALITITPNPSFLIVPEDQPGAFNFTVQNISTGIIEVPASPFGVTPIEFITVAAGDPTLGNVNQINDGIEFVSGDENDRVTMARLVQGADFCSGFNLGPQGTCVFSVFFNTADNNKAQSDTNTGVWKIYVSVGFFPAGQQFQSVEHANVSVEVEIPAQSRRFRNLLRSCFSLPASLG